MEGPTVKRVFSYTSDYRSNYKLLLTLMPLATWMYFFINAMDTYLSLMKLKNKVNITRKIFSTKYVCKRFLSYFISLFKTLKTYLRSFRCPCNIASYFSKIGVSVCSSSASGSCVASVSVVTPKGKANKEIMNIRNHKT